MKIGIVSSYFYPWYGGITEHVYHQYRELKRRGHDVRVITPFDGRYMLEDAGDLIRIGKPLFVRCNGSVGCVPLIGHGRERVKSVVAKEGFDILHFHQPLLCRVSMALIDGVRDERRRGRKAPGIVGTFHSCGGRWERLLLVTLLGPYLRRFRADFDCKIAVSNASEEFMRSVLPGHYEIVPNGVDVERFAAGGEPVSELVDGRINVLFVGRLEPRKGIAELLRSLALVAGHTATPFRLIVVGDGPYAKRYRTIAARQGVDNVVFVGDVSSHDLPRFYRTAQVFCSPAVSGESFGIVLLEAMAAGLAVIGGDNEGYRKVIRSGQNGILVDPADHDALARSIAALIDSPAERARLGAQARRDSLRYRWADIFTVVEHMYRRVMADNQR
jgi:phosphatidylinositol alpha-mannosyltransferase